MKQPDKRIFRVQRARGFRLYTTRGRLVDLWLADGAALFGHKPAGFVHTLKNAAERGLFAPYPSHYHARFEKALTRLFPGRVFRIYEASRLGREKSALLDTFVPPPVWRPFAEAAGAAALRERIFTPALPSPLAPRVLACAAGAEAALPSSDSIAPLTLACAEQSVCMLLNHPERGGVTFKLIEAALTSNTAWRREGIYLWYHGSEAWDELAARFFDAGFLVPPAPSSPLILPAELSAGEEQKLARALSAP